MQASEKIKRAKIKLLLDQPFFGSLVLGLKFAECGDQVCPIMATNGQSIFWNAKGVDQMTEEETVTVLAHEALHVALLHPLRRGQRDPYGWNVACDHAVNLHLDECNEMATRAGRRMPFPWPKFGALKDPQHKGKCAEEIYTTIPPQPKGGNGPGDPNGMGGVLDAPGDASEQREIEAKIKVSLAQAAAMGKGQGTMPASLARLVDDVLNPSRRWQDVLREFVTTAAKDDYSFSRPNRRYVHTGFILPSLYSQRLDRIAVAVDTSGSIDPELLNLFLAELEQIASEMKPEGITLIDCDAAINSVREVEHGDSLPRDFVGGGGTDFRPVFEHLKNSPPVVCIYFTDLDGSFPDEQPGFPVIWAAYNHSGKQAPFGLTVDIKAN